MNEIRTRGWEDSEDVYVRSFSPRTGRRLSTVNQDIEKKSTDHGVELALA
jgi:hypothetical protein